MQSNTVFFFFYKCNDSLHKLNILLRNSLIMTLCHHMTKFADDTTLMGLISCNDETACRNEISSIVDWCSSNNLEQNVDITQEVVVDLHHCKDQGDLLPLAINNQGVERADHLKFLGTTISSLELHHHPEESSPRTIPSKAA